MVYVFSFSEKVDEVGAAHPWPPAPRLLEERVAVGLHAVRVLSYEEAGALNRDPTTGTADAMPLVWRGHFETRETGVFPGGHGAHLAAAWQESANRTATSYPPPSGN